MPISIKNDETEQLARKLSEITGESLTDTIRIALSERYERVRGKKTRPLREELMAIARRCASRPVLSDASEDEILGYDEFGVPRR